MQARELADKLKELPPNDPYRVKRTRELIGKLYSLGLIASADSLERVGKVRNGRKWTKKQLLLYAFYTLLNVVSDGCSFKGTTLDLSINCNL